MLRFVELFQSTRIRTGMNKAGHCEVSEAALNFPTALSVGELTAYLKTLLERDEILADISVRGEISNFKRHASGHLYFSLKDENSTLNCVFFRSWAQRLAFAPEDGQMVIAEGAVTIYEKQGRYQLMVRAMRPDGVGDLAAAFEQLRVRLEAEGLFEPARKRPLPPFPRAIALLTSTTGAAVRDMITIISRRFPLTRIILVPTVVQGPEAAPSIVNALQRANSLTDAEVVILGRGGGSQEDLWCFNEEIVARAIFASRLPVVSAVGHETDFSLADFVADLRAPTPSAAAEMVVPDQADLLRRLDALGRNLQTGLQAHIAQVARRVARVTDSIHFTQPLSLVEKRQMRLDDAGDALKTAFVQYLARGQGRLREAQVALAALNPEAVLMRGYAICRRSADGRVVRSVDDVTAADCIEVTVRDGKFAGVVQSAEKM